MITDSGRKAVRKFTNSYFRLNPLKIPALCLSFQATSFMLLMLFLFVNFTLVEIKVDWFDWALYCVEFNDVDDNMNERWNLCLWWEGVWRTYFSKQKWKHNMWLIQWLGKATWKFRISSYYEDVVRKVCFFGELNYLVDGLKTLILHHSKIRTLFFSKILPPFSWNVLLKRCSVIYIEV
jgi:hypothetical protein